jgi:hypothetical protein
MRPIGRTARPLPPAARSRPLSLFRCRPPLCLPGKPQTRAFGLEEGARPPAARPAAPRATPCLLQGRGCAAGRAEGLCDSSGPAMRLPAPRSELRFGRRAAAQAPSHAPWSLPPPPIRPGCGRQERRCAPRWARDLGRPCPHAASIATQPLRATRHRRRLAMKRSAAGATRQPPAAQLVAACLAPQLRPSAAAQPTWHRLAPPCARCAQCRGRLPAPWSGGPAA